MPWRVSVAIAVLVSIAPAPAIAGSHSSAPTVSSPVAATGSRARLVTLRLPARRTGPLAPSAPAFQLSTPACQNGWTIIPSQGPSTSILERVATMSESDVWAVGGTGATSSNLTTSLAEHWDGLTWSTPSIPPSPGTAHNELIGVAAIASNDVWAVGGTASSTDPSSGTPLDVPLSTHWNGSSWSLVSTPAIPANTIGQLFGVSGVASNDVWAVGSYDDGTTTFPLAEHWDGNAWAINSPGAIPFGDGGLNAVTAIASNDVWAVGSIVVGGILKPRASHWNGATWTSSGLPSVGSGDNDLLEVAHGPGATWAVGYSTTASNGISRTLIEWWNGSSWVVVASPNQFGTVTGIEYGNALAGVTVIGSRDAWAVGAFYNATRNEPLIEHWNGVSWGIVQGPHLDAISELLGVSGEAATNVWAVGDENGQSGHLTLTQRFGPPVVNGVTPDGDATSGGDSIQVSGVGFSCATGVQIGGSPATGFTVNSDTSLNITTPAHRTGTVDVLVGNPVAYSARKPPDRLTYVPLYRFGTAPIATSGTLTAGQSQPVTVTALDYDGTAVSGASILLSFQQAAGGGSASVGATPLTATPAAFTADASGQVTATYTTPAALPASGVDRIQAQDGFPFVVLQDPYDFSRSTTFYFSEGYTGSGFTEDLSLFMPAKSGTAQIQYFAGPFSGMPVNLPLTAGKVTLEHVNADVPNQAVSALVTLPDRGVVERTMNFNTGTWRGSTDIVGAGTPATQWNFAEGSTLNPYSEYLTLLNTNPYRVQVDLQYMLDNGAHPIKTLTLAGGSRTTVVVFQGDVNDNPNCLADYGGNCGVGPGHTGVSVRVQSRTLPIVAERPFYVNNYSFGSGAIRDGHVAFGATSGAAHWFFAEGNTLPGWNEYLTIQNPNAFPVTVTIIYYINAATQPTKNLTLVPLSRATVAVFQGDTNGATCTPQGGGDCGVGPGYVEVGAELIASGGPIVVERPMYMVQNFGSGTVAGADDVLGLGNPVALYGFAHASTVAGDDDYLTLVNPRLGSATATVTITYYTQTGTVTRTIMVPVNTRHTVVMSQVNNPIDHQLDGLGGGDANVGMVISSDQPVLVEKPTYSSNAATYGATVTTGYGPPDAF